MVYIYGGGFSTGEATKNLNSPDYFMKKNIVLVTFNYRLCALGNYTYSYILIQNVTIKNIYSLHGYFIQKNILFFTFN